MLVNFSDLTYMSDCTDQGSAQNQDLVKGIIIVVLTWHI